MAQFQAIDSDVAKALAAPMYGNMYWDSTASGTAQTNAVTNTWYGITDFTEGVVSGVTTDTSDGTADHFIIPAGGAGDYEVSFNVNADPSAASEQMEFSVFVGSSEQVSTTAIIYKSADTNYLTVSGNTILTLAAADEVSLRHRNVTGTGGFDLIHADLSINRISY